LVDESGNGIFDAWEAAGRLHHDYPAISLPPGKVLDIITVIKGNG
jgi:hypothetical protein